MSNQLHDIPGVHVQQTPLKAHAAATATELTGVFSAPFKCKILSVSVRWDAAITGANTNTTHVNVINAGTNGAGTTEIGNVDYVSGTDAVAGAVVPLAAPSGGLVVNAGTLIQIQHQKVGNGLNIPAGIVSVEYVGA